MPTLEQTIYNYYCLWDKHAFSRSNPYICIDCPCALLKFMANARQIGNYNILILIGESEKIIGICDIKTCSPFQFTITTFDLMTYFAWFFWQLIVFRCKVVQIYVSQKHCGWTNFRFRTERWLYWFHNDLLTLKYFYLFWTVFENL